jgi:class 3 adenylate cyclase/pimeloyl-ACP methyl ester carboxylesterase
MQNDGVRYGPTSYVNVEGSQVAYQVTGSGPVDFVFMMGIGSNFQYWWDHPPFGEVLERISKFARLILFDRRGSGISDALPQDGLSTWECFTDDLGAVLDITGSKEAVIMASFDAGPVAITFAAMNPNRVRGLVLWNSYARFTSTDDYTCGVPPEVFAASSDYLKSMWGTEELARYLSGISVDGEHLQWLVRLMRGACTPASYARQNAFMSGADARGGLPLLQAPVLAFNTTEYIAIPADLGRYVAENVRDGRFVALVGAEQDLFARSDRGELLDRIEEFSTGLRPTSRAHRVLASVLFTDIVASTERAARMGDAQWRSLLDAHDRTAQSVIDSWRGRVIKSTGDGVLATFDGPGRALQASLELRSSLATLEVEIRAGVHFGEIELRENGDIGGIGVHLAARAMGKAQDGEVVCTRTVKELSLGSGLRFDDRGIHSLKGIPEQWQLYAVMSN